MFKQAVKESVRLRLALTGPSGAGKTMSALRIARGLVPNAKIALIDTENCSASLYADKVIAGAEKYGPVKFATAQMSAPFLIEKYLKAIDAAVEGDFDVIVIDSLSHAWAGEGGVLQQKEALDARGGNSFTNWGKMTPQQNKLVNAVLHSKKHIICTMRSKTEYVVSQNAQGKSAPMKVGLQAVQRDGFEYEFDLVLDMGFDHTAQASKDRSDLFNGQTFQPTEKTGELLRDWLKGADPAPPPPASPPPAAATKPEAPSPAQTPPAASKPQDAPPASPPGTPPGTPPRDLTPAELMEDPLSYRVKINGRYFGQELRAIPAAERRGYMNWLIETAREKNVPLSAQAKDYIEFVKLADKKGTKA